MEQQQLDVTLRNRYPNHEIPSRARLLVQIVAGQIPEKTALPSADAELKHTFLERPPDTDD